MTLTTVAPAPLAVFDRALVEGSRGRAARLIMHAPDGAEHLLDAAAWCAARIPGDAGLLGRCQGRTLDVGCGPGRLSAALTRRGTAVLGIDLSATAVRLTRARGARARRRDVFGSIPGGWADLLLADGNVGIGGDPVRMLRRCRELLAPGGRIHLESAAPGVASWSGPVRISPVDTDLAGPPSTPFDWAVLGADAIADVAAAAGLRPVTFWADSGRHFATLDRG